MSVISSQNGKYNGQSTFADASINSTTISKRTRGTDHAIARNFFCLMFLLIASITMTEAIRKNIAIAVSASHATPQQTPISETISVNVKRTFFEFIRIKIKKLIIRIEPV